MSLTSSLVTVGRWVGTYRPPSGATPAVFYAVCSEGYNQKLLQHVRDIKGRRLE